MARNAVAISAALKLNLDHQQVSRHVRGQMNCDRVDWQAQRSRFRQTMMAWIARIRAWYLINKAKKLQLLVSHLHQDTERQSAS